MRQQMDKLGQILQRPAEADGRDLQAGSGSSRTACSAATRNGQNDPLLNDMPMEDGMPQEQQQGQQPAKRSSPIALRPDDGRAAARSAEAVARGRTSSASSWASCRRASGMGMKPGRASARRSARWKAPVQANSARAAASRPSGPGPRAQALRQGARDMMSQMMQAQQGRARARRARWTIRPERPRPARPPQPCRTGFRRSGEGA
jgi:hypothetical protein